LFLIDELENNVMSRHFFMPPFCSGHGSGIVVYDSYATLEVDALTTGRVKAPESRDASSIPPGIGDAALDKKDSKSTGNPLLTLALLGPLGSLFGVPHPRRGRVESKPGPVTPKRPH
jgi:hypothetical protein